MDRGRQEQAGSEDPQQRAFNGIATPGHPGDDRQHEGGGGRAGLDGVSHDRRDHREGAFVGRPVAGVGAQTLGERGGTDAIEGTHSAQRADAREGEVEDGTDGDEGEERGRAAPANEGGQGRRRGELDEGGGGEQGAARRAPACHQDQRRQQEEAHRVEVGAPGRLDDQEG